MKKYAIIIEENNTQMLEEVKTINDVLDTLLNCTDYFTPEEDSICEELIELKDFKALANQMTYCYCNKEPQTSLAKRYCEILDNIKNSKTIDECYQILPRLNILLKEVNQNTEVFLNDREDDGCGWSGKEEGIMRQVIMPNFLKKENLKYVIEYNSPDGGTFYKATEDAPKKIKKEIKEWNEMFERAVDNHIKL